MMKVKIVNKSRHQLPAYSTVFSAGMDLRANILEDVILKPGERKLIQTGLFIGLPQGYEAQIRPRSGLALKSGISLVNTPGTIDADYRGEIGVIMINHSDTEFLIHDGDRICQMVVKKYETVEWILCEELAATDRGEGGFGHTGKS